MAIVLCVLITVAVYFSSYLEFIKSAKRRFCALAILIVVAVIGAALFLTTTTSSVRTIDIPAAHQSVTVSVGYVRTDFARSLPDLPANPSDWDLLRARGQSEEEIRKLWTWSSILLARLMLLTAYLLFLLPAVAVGSLAVLYEGVGPPSAS